MNSPTHALPAMHVTLVQVDDDVKLLLSEGAIATVGKLEVFGAELLAALPSLSALRRGDDPFAYWDSCHGPLIVEWDPTGAAAVRVTTCAEVERYQGGVANVIDRVVRITLTPKMGAIQ